MNQKNEQTNDSKSLSRYKVKIQFSDSEDTFHIKSDIQQIIVKELCRTFNPNML